MKRIYLLATICIITFLQAQNSVDVQLNIYNYQASARPTRLTEWNGNIIFSGIRDERTGGNELWLHNRDTNKSSVIKNLSQNTTGNFDRIKSNIVKFNDKLYFIGTENGEANNQLWESDGTTAGTRLIKQLYNSSLGDTLKNLFVENGKLFIATVDQLWISDGTSVGTVMLTENYYNTKFFSLNDKIYFWHDFYDKEVLMVSDGTVSGTKVFKTFEPTNGSYGTNSEILVFQNHLYFVGKLNGVKSIWKSDGTAEGTAAMVNTNLNTLKGEILPDKFLTYDENNNLWSSDGTAANTLIYKTLTSEIQKMFKFKNEIYIDTKTEFVKTNGTASGTQTHNFTDNDQALNYYTQSNQNNYLLLKTEYEYSPDTWIWNGTAQNADKLKFGSRYTRPTEYLEVDQDLYYPGYSQTNGEEIFKYNYTSKEEKLVTDINFVYDSRANAYQKAGDNFFFMADSSSNTRQIFKKDLTTGKISQVSDFKTNSGQTNRALAVGNYYYSYDYSYNQGFNRTDGTAVNSKVFNIGTAVIDIFNLNDQSVIYVVRKESNLQVYRLDNTADEPVLLKEQPNSSYTETGQGAMINGELYFIFRDTNNHLSIWKTDGTQENTVKAIEFPFDNLEKLKILGAVNGKLIFYKTVAAIYGKYDLYSSSGNQNDVNLLSNLNAKVVDLTEPFNDKLYFVTDGPQILYSTDGTLAGTKSLKQLGYNNTYGLKMKKCGEYLFTMVDYNLWRTDGNSAGTIQLASNMSANEMACNKNYLYASALNSPQLFRTSGNRSSKTYINLDVTKSTTQVIEQHEILNVALKDLASDGQTIYFNGYGNKSDFQQYEVIDILPEYLAVNENVGLDKKDNVLIYPNPVTDVFSVRVLNKEIIKKIEIIDVSGKIIFTTTVIKDININNLSQAIYFIKTYTDSNIYTTKLIKK